MSEEKKKNLVRFGAVIAIAALIVAVPLFWRALHQESTDDAFIDAHVVPISPQVAGRISRVYVSDNQRVKAGDPLFDIDDRDYAAKLAEQRAKVAKAEAESARAAVDARRYAEIYQKDEISKQQLDQANADADTTRAQVAQEQAAAEKAELDLSYTKVRAPESGRVTRKNVEAGAYVEVGQVLLAIVPEEVWVTANFKETQITHMRPGQQVQIKVDAYPGKIFHGRVDSIQAGTGERFSLLPPENATGNYVKVVQRIPVKIILDDTSDPQYLLAPGMSVVPTVYVK